MVDAYAQCCAREAARRRIAARQRFLHHPTRFPAAVNPRGNKSPVCSSSFSPRRDNGLKTDLPWGGDRCPRNWLRAWLNWSGNRGMIPAPRTAPASPVGVTDPHSGVTAAAPLFAGMRRAHVHPVHFAGCASLVKRQSEGQNITVRGRPGGPPPSVTSFARRRKRPPAQSLGDRGTEDETTDNPRGPSPARRSAFGLFDSTNDRHGRGGPCPPTAFLGCPNQRLQAGRRTIAR